MRISCMIAAAVRAARSVFTGEPDWPGCFVRIIPDDVAEPAATGLIVMEEAVCAWGVRVIKAMLNPVRRSGLVFIQ